jgi:hypothetical protein
MRGHGFRRAEACASAGLDALTRVPTGARDPDPLWGTAQPGSALLTRGGLAWPVDTNFPADTRVSRDMSSETGILSSPRKRRRILWGGGGVLAVVLIVVFATLDRGSSGAKSPISTVAAQTAPKQIPAKPDPKAFEVARKFLETAVLRKNLDVAYALVNDEIKGHMTRKQWNTGNISVISYPAANAKTAGFSVEWSYKTQMMTVVDLVAKKGSHVRPRYVPFFLGLVRAHNKSNGHWLVNYFQAQPGVNVVANN